MLVRKALLESSIPRQSLLAHAFTVIAWMMAISVTVTPLLWNKIGWEADCMTINYETSKTNQKDARYVFANPIDPLIYPALALGLKIINEADIGIIVRTKLGLTQLHRVRRLYCYHPSLP